MYFGAGSEWMFVGYCRNVLYRIVTGQFGQPSQNVVHRTLNYYGADAIGHLCVLVAALVPPSATDLVRRGLQKERCAPARICSLYRNVIIGNDKRAT
jgi:hypothetical protein